MSKSKKEKEKNPLGNYPSKEAKEKHKEQAKKRASRVLKDKQDFYKMFCG